MLENTDVRVVLAALLVANLLPAISLPVRTYRLLILLDLSGSMTAPSAVLVADLHERWLSELNRALGKFGTRLSASDHVCLGTFASKILISPQCSSGGPADLVGPFMALDQRGSPSPIGSAVWSGVEMMRTSRQADATDLIIVVTDGLTSGNEHRTAEVAAFAERNNIAVHTVVTRPALWGTSAGATMARALKLMKDFAEQTGGTSTECSRTSSRFDCQKPAGGLAAVFENILTAAHSGDSSRVASWASNPRGD